VICIIFTVIYISGKIELYGDRVSGSHDVTIEFVLYSDEEDEGFFFPLQ
jgi:hypothetical protein